MKEDLEIIAKRLDQIQIIVDKLLADFEPKAKPKAEVDVSDLIAKKRAYEIQFGRK